MSTTKLTVTENLITYVCLLSHSRPTNKENQVKMNKSAVLGALAPRTGKDPYPDPDPYPYQIVGS
jgi:hypothetical protein